MSLSNLKTPMVDVQAKTIFSSGPTKLTDSIEFVNNVQTTSQTQPSTVYTTFSTIDDPPKLQSTMLNHTTGSNPVGIIYNSYSTKPPTAIASQQVFRTSVLSAPLSAPNGCGFSLGVNGNNGGGFQTVSIGSDGYQDITGLVGMTVNCTVLCGLSGFSDIPITLTGDPISGGTVSIAQPTISNISVGNGFRINGSEGGTYWYCVLYA